MATDYVDLTNTIVTNIVDTPEAVEVVLLPRGRTSIIEVAVADGDMGKVIGKGGRNIEAIRAVVRAAGLRQHERVQVELREDDEDDDEYSDGPAVASAQPAYSDLATEVPSGD